VKGKRRPVVRKPPRGRKAASRAMPSRAELLAKVARLEATLANLSEGHRRVRGYLESWKAACERKAQFMINPDQLLEHEIDCAIHAIRLAEFWRTGEGPPEGPRLAELRARENAPRKAPPHYPIPGKFVS